MSGPAPRLVVTLGSASCDRAVETAVGAAVAAGAPVVLAYVVDTSFLASTTREVHGMGEMEGHLKHIGKLILARQERAATAGGATVATEVATDEPARAVAGLVRRHKVKDVYMGRDAVNVLDKGERQTIDAVVQKAGGRLTIVP